MPLVEGDDRIGSTVVSNRDHPHRTRSQTRQPKWNALIFRCRNGRLRRVSNRRGRKWSVLLCQGVEAKAGCFCAASTVHSAQPARATTMPAPTRVRPMYQDVS
jgi:hypothetical protein